MKKIISLFKRDYEGTRRVYDEVVPGAEWVLAGEGVATRKWDGTCCLVRNGVLWRRYDRKITKAAKKRGPPFTAKDSKPMTADKEAAWYACQSAPDPYTGHWPGWLEVGDEAGDKWHYAVWTGLRRDLEDGTYELCGPHFQGNPECLARDVFLRHGAEDLADAPRTFAALKEWFKDQDIEGIVWHHPDGRMVKIKKKDFWGKR
jgi:hypothetical protein